MSSGSRWLGHLAQAPTGRLQTLAQHGASILQVRAVSSRENTNVQTQDKMSMRQC